MTITAIHPTAIIERVDPATAAASAHSAMWATMWSWRRLRAQEPCGDFGSDHDRTARPDLPFASIGHAPRDLKYAGEPSTLTIGADCTIREGVTMRSGTAGGAMKTVVGDRCVFLANAHVAHDCTVGDSVLFSSNA